MSAVDVTLRSAGRYLDFEAFRELASRPGLSLQQRIGFTDELRAGFTAAILQDIRTKLPSLNDRGLKILDIGPGCGELALGIIELAAERGHELCLVDSAEMLAHLPDESFVDKVPGRFPDILQQVKDAVGAADAILCYSVLHHAWVDTNVFDFLDGCLSLLRPFGRLLIGDVPNVSMRNRFFATDAGRNFHRRHTGTDTEPVLSSNRSTPGEIDDAVIVSMLLRARAAGIHAYVVPQHADLPLANRREDLLFVKP